MKSKSGEGRGDPLEMVGPEKRRRLRVAAESFLAARPELTELECSFEVVAVRRATLERIADAF